MTKIRWIGTLALAAIVLGAGARPLGAQGPTTAAVSGRVVDSTSGQAIEAAQVQVRNGATGFTTGAVTKSDGRYFVAGLEVGGPYSITVRRIGFEPQAHDDVTLRLGQTFEANFRLVPRAAQLTEVVVTATGDQGVIGPSRKGVQTLIGDTALRRLPTLTRNFTDFVALTPQVATAQSGGLTAAGSNNRYNTIQIDGATESDMFGLGSTGQPGGEARAKSISIEAVKEYQVLLTPFDVRFGNFSGALVNAVTKSGTNELHGSAYYYFRNQDLARNSPVIRALGFQQEDFGFSLGGPIVQDKVHFFIAPEFQKFKVPTPGPYIGGVGTNAAPVSQQDIDSLSKILTQIGDAQGYQFNPGSAGPSQNNNPLTNIFARLDFQLPGNNRLVLRHNYDHAELDTLFRTQTNIRLTSNGFTYVNDKNATVAQLFTNFANGMSNEFFAGYTRIRDTRPVNSLAPELAVRMPSGATVTVGTENFRQANALSQDIFEIRNDFTIPMGSHRITIGTRDQFMSVDNLFGQSAFGQYSFGSLDSLALLEPNSYTIALNLGQGFDTKFHAQNWAFYAEDQWQVTPTFNVLYGLRADIPTMTNDFPRNQLIASTFGRNTDELPTGNVQWSPRVSFNWDVTGDQTNQLRGGVGLFQGTPPYVWISNAIANNGFGLGLLTCGRNGLPGTLAPNFAINPQAQAQQCVDSAGQPIGAGGYSEVDLLDKNLKFPQDLRFSLGYDRALGQGFVATIEGLYTRYVNQFFYKNLNMQGPVGTDAYGRVIYGTITTSGFATPNTVSAQFNANGVIDVVNQSKDYSYSLTGQLRKRFSDNFEASAAYTYSRTRSVQDLTSSRAISNFRFGRELSGDVLAQNTGISLFDFPHKVTVNGTYTFPWRTWRTDLSLIYIGTSGVPFDYVVGGGIQQARGGGDLNADGIRGNDLIYVPKNALDPSEILFAPQIDRNGNVIATPETQAQLYNQFIEGEACLRDHRGEILPRNACRSPWVNQMNLSLRQSLPTWEGRAVTLQLDVFNFLNMLDSHWGLVKLPWDSPSFNNQNLLRHAGQTPVPDGGTTADTRPIFQFPLNRPLWSADNFASNYQVQLSARLAF